MKTLEKDLEECHLNADSSDKVYREEVLFDGVGSALGMSKALGIK